MKAMISDAAAPDGKTRPCDACALVSGVMGAALRHRWEAHMRLAGVLPPNLGAA
jgi:hypothetical protein